MPSPAEEPPSEKLLKAASFLLTAPLGRALVTLFAGVTGTTCLLLPKVPLWIAGPLVASLCIIVCLWLLCFPVILARAKKKGELVSLESIAKIREEDDGAYLKPEDAARVIVQKYVYIFKVMDAMFGARKKPDEKTNVPA
jgi:hypothetical protein